MNHKILVLDIDGTLTNSKKEITTSTKNALFALQAAGYSLAIASGRPTAGIEPIAKECKLRMQRPCLCLFIVTVQMLDI